MTVSLLLFCLCLGAEGTDRDLRELVYQAEVFGRESESLVVLRQMLSGASGDRSRQIAWALAMVKFRQPRPEDADALLVGLARPAALVNYRGMGYLLVGTRWLELGDWLGSNFLVAIESDRIILQNRDGFQQEIARLEASEPLQANQCLLQGAPLADVLAFAARNADLNSFLPSNLTRSINGRYPISDWVSLLDQVCRATGVIWTRRGDSVIFSTKPETVAAVVSKRESFTRRGQDLQSFLHWLSERFDLELVTEAVATELLDTRVDIYAQDQSWEETLDCLAVMNGFNWAKIEDEGRPKLVITPNR